MDISKFYTVMMLAGDRGEKYLKLYEISKQVSFDGRNEDF
jgi:hypothetical protein